MLNSENLNLLRKLLMSMRELKNLSEMEKLLIRIREMLMSVGELKNLKNRPADRIEKQESGLLEIESSAHLDAEHNA